MKRMITVSLSLILLTMLFTTVCNAQVVVPLPPRSNYAPDLQLIVVGGMPGGDIVNVTYPDVPPGAVLQGDVAALAHELDVRGSNAKVTNSGLPESGGQTPPMTSVTLVTQGAAPLTTGTLPIDKLIMALRKYHRLAITYIMPPTFRYTGFHRYTDQNISIGMTQSGSTYCFLVDINNSAFSTITLPLGDNSRSGSIAQGSTRQHRPGILVTVIEFAAAFLAAALIGWGVYAAMSKIK